MLILCCFSFHSFSTVQKIMPSDYVIATYVEISVMASGSSCSFNKVSKNACHWILVCTLFGVIMKVKSY